jgi:transcriptional repressor NrdR
MNCPYCFSTEAKVTDKRSSSDGIRRRRECLKCRKRFTTYERIEPMDLYVIKKDGRREKFAREKIERGMERAFEKLPISKDNIQKIINEIEESLRKLGKKEVRSSIIGDLIMKKLKKVNNIAYIRFASVYREFKDVSDFKKELKGL